MISIFRIIKMSSRLAELREKSRKRKELLKVTLGVDNISEALGCDRQDSVKNGDKHRKLESERETSGQERLEGAENDESNDASDTAEFRDSTAFLKGTQSLNPHNDYSQNFVDTGQRPQNFIRDTGLTGRFEEYPKLQELIRLKDDLISRTAHPPMYLKCDLENYDMKQLNCKFDTIIIEPPLEEYSRAYGVTGVKFWDWDRIMALDIAEVS